jgi:1-aminocyclopropane-1-carboxylate deaminase/D-cysteine desulfhydrase-like pyridoxal-dependent ACC family enzyme
MNRATSTYESHAFTALASLPLWQRPTPVEELSRLRAALGGGPRLLVKRDDTLPFGGGNKVRKLALVAAQALAEGADTLITCGGVQSNHARATAAVAARFGLRAVLVHNGAPPTRLAGNALLGDLYGAERVYVDSREARAPTMASLATQLRAEGRRPFVIPLGASTALGAAAYVRAIAELLSQGVRPDVIVHACASGGTQAGLVIGCHLHGLDTRIVGISADEPEVVLGAEVRRLVDETCAAYALRGTRVPAAAVTVDDGFIGGGYGVPTAESTAALQRFARTEALLLDPTYTAKAAAALIAGVGDGRFRADQTVLFWHTGGVPGLFAS